MNTKKALTLAAAMSAAAMSLISAGGGVTSASVEVGRTVIRQPASPPSPPTTNLAAWSKGLKILPTTTTTTTTIVTTTTTPPKPPPSPSSPVVTSPPESQAGGNAPAPSNAPETQAAGKLDSTAYCQSGTMADGGDTYAGAAASNLFAFGTKVHILSGPLAGTTVTVEDRVGWGSDLDIFMWSCQAADDYGRNEINYSIN